MRLISTFTLLLTPLFYAGCAHYYLPATHLETPEVSGVARVGRLELLGIQGGTDLTAAPERVTPDAKSTDQPYYRLNPYLGGLSLGFVKALTDQWDIGVRLEPFAPLLFRAKHQFLGSPESTAGHGNLSLAASIGAGLLLGGGDAQSTVSYYLVDASLLGGYRFNTHHLLTLAPFLSVAGLSGVSLSATTPAGTPSAVNSASALQFGIGLGYQYTNQSLFLRGEADYAGGSFGSAKLSGPTLGAMLGLNL